MNTTSVIHSGEIGEERDMPSLNHSFVCQSLGVALHAFGKQFTVYQQLSLNLDGWQSVPDVCMYSRETLQPDWMEDQDEVKQPPLLVIEVLSPKQSIQWLLDKVKQYLKHGVQSCWIVFPSAGSISVYPQSGPSRTFSEGMLRDERIGIEIKVAEIFS